MAKRWPESPKISKESGKTRSKVVNVIRGSDWQKKNANMQAKCAKSGKNWLKVSRKDSKWKTTQKAKKNVNKCLKMAKGGKRRSKSGQNERENLIMFDMSDTSHAVHAMCHSARGVEASLGWLLFPRVIWPFSSLWGVVDGWVGERTPKTRF